MAENNIAGIFSLWKCWTPGTAAVQVGWNRGVVLRACGAVTRFEGDNAVPCWLYNVGNGFVFSLLSEPQLCEPADHATTPPVRPELRVWCVGRLGHLGRVFSVAPELSQYVQLQPGQSGQTGGKWLLQYHQCA